MPKNKRSQARLMNARVIFEGMTTAQLVELARSEGIAASTRWHTSTVIDHLMRRRT